MNCDLIMSHLCEPHIFAFSPKGDQSLLIVHDYLVHREIIHFTLPVRRNALTNALRNQLEITSPNTLLLVFFM